MAPRLAAPTTRCLSPEGDLLRIEQPSEGWELFGHRRMDVELTLPLGLRAAGLHTGHGRAEAHGLEGELQIHTGHGGATLRACRAGVKVSTGHGNLTIEGHRGRIKGASGHGRLRVEGLEGDAELHTGHGNVDLIDRPAA